MQTNLQMSSFFLFEEIKNLTDRTARAVMNRLIFRNPRDIPAESFENSVKQPYCENIKSIHKKLALRSSRWYS